MNLFQGKVAVVTGAASGIGRALVEHCVQEGIKVILADVEEQIAKNLEHYERCKTMSMQEPEQWQSFEAPAISEQGYGASRAEREQHAQEQKMYPQETREARASVLNILTIVFSGIGFGPAIVGMAVSALTLSNRDGSQDLLMCGILGLVGSIVTLFLFVTLFVLSIVSAVRRAARYRRLRFR